MPRSVPFIYDHRHHRLQVFELEEYLDILTFEGEEQLSQPFIYRITFTNPRTDLGAELFLGQPAHFSLYAENAWRQKVCPAFGPPVIKPLRRLDGVITAFRSLGSTADEGRYEVTLEPRLALLGRGKQTRIYVNKTVPQVVEHVLRERHGFRRGDFIFNMARQYPHRDQVIQYDESDLAFISRLLADIGIWYRITSDARLNMDVVEFHDDPRYYQFGLELPSRPRSGLAVGDKDSVYALQTRHQVVEKYLHVRSYDHRHAKTWLAGEVSQLGPLKLPDWTRFTYGEAYHYGDAFSEMGGALDMEEDLLSESGYFYARLRHERYLNEQTRLTGSSDSAALAPGQVLKVTDGAPHAFAPGAVLTRLSIKASRDSSLVLHFDAIPYNPRICFRPVVPPKPRIAGTLPARVSSTQVNDLYSHIDKHGHYRVKFLFDRDTWNQGYESALLRLARPYAGDTYGLHLPLIVGTEVAIAFEQGDPDRPYIAHALHDSDHPDHVGLLRRDYKRNVLRTPSNNKLRMEDERGIEHVKLSTEHSGKSQLNLGHLVDANRSKRGEGFELRSDGWGAIRAGKGLLISADEQAKAQGPILSMQPASQQIEQACQQMAQHQTFAQAHHSREPDSAALQRLQADAEGLQAPAILLSAPKGIAAVTPASLLLHSDDGLYLQSRDEINLVADQRLAAHSEKAMSLLAREEGLRLVSGKGPLEIESHGDLLNLVAQQDITVQSVQGHLQLTAKNGITLGCGGGFIRITPQGEIQIHSTGLLTAKGKHRFEPPGGESFPLPELPGSVCKECLRNASARAKGFMSREMLS